MIINTKTLVSITEANQNFSKVARLVDENGIAVVMKNNVPRYVIMEFSRIEQEEIAAQEDVMTLSNRFINKNREAYEALAK
ncbi:MAG: type II toxin-antitoxin system Phd/YefM family antitoxin [Bacillota bacterium]|nr:type II toxin-antitoxin system Phd/YefM family antitoxin [Bacillota bacterium]